MSTGLIIRVWSKRLLHRTYTGCRSEGLLRLLNRNGVRETPELPPLALPKVSLRLLRRIFNKQYLWQI
jgi:hypothetical protein